MFNFQKIKRGILVFIFFYMASMMIVMGNGHSFLGRYLSAYFIPVANTIGLNTTWNFFSPDPANTMYFRYFILFEDDYGKTLKESVEGYFPTSKDQGHDFRLDQRRSSYMMRWLAIEPSRVAQFYIPYLCREHPGAKKIQIEFIVNTIPALEKIVTFKNENYEDFVQPEEISRNVYECT